MNMIERVARALAADDSGPEGSYLFEIHWAEFGDGYMKSACAAIKAMREPTQAMSDAGRDNNYMQYADPAWRFMIDAALQEEGG